MRLPFPRPLRNSEAPVLFESFFVAAVVSFLGIRAFLTVTGFPKVGSGEFHIAHMLWGGALMLAGLLLLLAYLDRSIQHVAAIVAGLGFGTFVDEIGKYVTADNDYFFRPAIALIYVVFVIVFLVARALAGQERLTRREALANSLDLLESAIERPIEADDRARIVALLRHSGTEPAPLIRAVRGYLASLPDRPDDDPWFEKLPARFGAAYARLVADPRFERVLTVLVVGYALAAVMGSLVVVAQAGPRTGDSPTVSAIGQVASTLAGGALVGRGVLSLPRSRLTAYRWFLRGLLVWILLTQMFVFYDSQLAGLGGLTIDLVAYATLRFAVAREGTASIAGDAAFVASAATGAGS